jgi:hypothetical protein
MNAGYSLRRPLSMPDIHIEEECDNCFGHFLSHGSND